MFRRRKALKKAEEYIKELEQKNEEYYKLAVSGETDYIQAIYGAKWNQVSVDIARLKDIRSILEG